MAWAKALYAVETDECSGCGHPKSVTTRLESAGAYVPTLLVCHACAAKDTAARAFLSASDGTKGGDPAGLLSSVHLRGRHG